MTKLLIFGTGNRHKGVEMAEILAPAGIVVKTLADFPDVPAVVEDGLSFAQNAEKKASQTARFLNRWVVAEDSGLSVDILGGEPGIYSARYSDPGATDERNNDLLLRKLGKLPPDKRSARYTCSMALCDPSGAVRFQCEEYCVGRILTERHGANGFGYDPLFEVVEYHRSFGELAPILKSVISHRARAVRRLLAALNTLTGVGE